MIRRRLAVFGVLYYICALGSVLTFYGIWMAFLEKSEQFEYIKETASSLEAIVAPQLCDATSLQNDSKLFFDNCDVNIDDILSQTHRLATNFICPTDRSKAGAKMENKERLIQAYRNPFTCQEQITVRSQSPIFKLPFGDHCLKNFILNNCFDGLRVPKVVHFVWFSRHTMDVVTFLSVLASYRFLNPCLILFHADYPPFGSYWRALLSLVPVLMHVERSPPSSIHGKPLGSVQHKSDIARLQALKEYGGTYLDCDQIVVRSLDEYRDKEFVMGHESSLNLANSLLISAPNATFIHLWYENYRSYNPSYWGMHSTFLPFKLAHLYPWLIHNAGNAFIGADLPKVYEIWDGHYNWSENHAVHLYYRSVSERNGTRTNYSLKELTKLTSSLGEIARHIMFGSKEACISLRK